MNENKTEGIKTEPSGGGTSARLVGSVPVRLCCGERHWGAVCPDGNVMCCICFERVSQDDLRTLPNGKKEDVCKACDEMEKQHAQTEQNVAS